MLPGDVRRADVDRGVAVPARKARERRAVVRQDRTLKHARLSEIVGSSRRVVVNSTQLVTGGLELGRQRRVRARLLVAQRVRVEDPHRRDNGDSGHDEQTCE